MISGVNLCTVFTSLKSAVWVYIIIITRGQSNLTKSASRGAHSPVRGHPIESFTIEFLG